MRSVAALGMEARTIAFIAAIGLYRRYTGSLLGVGWSLLNPAAQLAIYSFAFGYVMKVPIDRYFLYLAAGLLPWTLLSAAWSQGATALLSRHDALNGSLLPMRVHVLADVTVELISFLLAMGILVVVSAVAQPERLYMLAFLPLYLLPLVIAAYAGAMTWAVASVWYRDLPYLLGIGLSVLFWLTPIAYHWAMVPELVGALVRYNPVALLISPLQVVVHGREFPSMALLGASWGVALVSVAAAVLTCRRYLPFLIYRL